MEHYVTLFDALFLPQGIALHASLERHAGSYALWVLCMDKTTYEVLQRLSLPNVRLLQIEQLETGELRRVKNDRTKVEYCWTITPFAPRFVFEADSSVARVTYIDADMWLRKNPAPIFHEFEMASKHVLITDHGYAPEYDQSAESGQYCVQFATFCRVGGEIVRKWWEERCVEWCYVKPDAGKFGDQKYLDDWTERFADHVYVLKQQEWMLAPWNSVRFAYSGAIWYHFHGLRICEKQKVALYNGYDVPTPTVENVYLPYIADIKESLLLLKGVGFIPLVQKKNATKSLIGRFIDKIFELNKHFWRYSPEPIIRL